MMSLEAIISENEKVARKAKRHGVKPLIAKVDRDKNIFSCLKLGDYVPKGWKLVEQLFVDNSGFGSSDEPALTTSQFLAKVKKGFGYAIIEEGQFQLYIGVYEKL